MGLMRFSYGTAVAVESWPEAHRAYLSGMDQSVWPTRIELADGLLICRRNTSDSAKLHVAWPVNGFGRPVITTASLPEREEPYLLPLELARGKIVQLRNQLATWEQLGMLIPQETHEPYRQAHHYFAKAAASQQEPDRAISLAQTALEKACQTAEVLTRGYVRQRLDARHRQYPRLPLALGCGLGVLPVGAELESEFITAFNTAVIPLEWRNIEPIEGTYHWELCDQQVTWAEKKGLMLRGGPLLDLSPDGLPRWLWQWEHDYWNLESFVCDFVETAIRRFLGRIRIWEVVARANTGGMLALKEEHRLSLVAKSLDIARRCDPEGEFIIRVDQPWGEYQARGHHRLSPLQFADALLRAGLPLSAINLEIGVGYAPRGSASRDLMDYSRLLDQWGMLGVPLQVTLAFPSAGEPDPRLESDLEVERSSWKEPWSEAAQANWIDMHLPLFMAKPTVTAIFWTHFSDKVPHRFPHAGMVGQDGQAKPGLGRFVHYRKRYW